MIFWQNPMIDAFLVKPDMQMVWKMLLLPGPLWPLELRMWHHKVPKPHLSNFTCQELLLVSEPGKTVKHLDVPQDQRFSPLSVNPAFWIHLDSPIFPNCILFFFANQKQQLQKPAVVWGDRLLADASDDDSESLEKDERRDLEQLQRIAAALVEFYGLGEVRWWSRVNSQLMG